ncbi:ubiquitin-like domain-containing protein [Streptomyces nondiastaticus]|uniref:Ubiquitin-like domain-containing protein n=1 Tax=Streptomyces nondiastaticus TaxID=3154512 RepID=A0ABW6U0I1_9ACTN
MTRHAQGSPRAARSGAAEAPPYDPFDPYNPYAAHDAYAAHDPYDPHDPYFAGRYDGGGGGGSGYDSSRYGLYAAYVAPVGPYPIYDPVPAPAGPGSGPYDPFLPEPREFLPEPREAGAGSEAPAPAPYEAPHLPRQPFTREAYAAGETVVAGEVVAEDAPTESPAREGFAGGPAVVDAVAPAAPRPAPDRRSGGRGRKRPGDRPDALRKLLPQALVVAFLAGGTSAFVADDKTVRLTVDGHERVLHTFADDVDELLADQGMNLGEHDAVSPGHGHDLARGDEITVRYGRPLALTLDGEHHRMWTTARTVDDALRQLGVRAEGAYLSADRAAPIGREGLDLAVRTERTVTFMADGRERTIRTNAATVHEAVEQAGISLHGEDTTSVDPDSFPREGQTISVMRITGSEEVREEPIDFTTERHDDPDLFKGTEVVSQRGEKGVQRITYALRTVNGVKQKPRRIASETVREPRTQIVRVGTKARPVSVQSGGGDGLNWEGLAQCEAGGRPDAVDPSGTYGGLYQFDVHTWKSLGGSGRPQDAPASEQTLRAKKLYVSRGASPWPVCGRKLHG